MICPSCHEQNDPLALVCFHCESPLAGPSIRRGMVIGSRYEILKWLGRGGMGTVYKAYDRVLEEEVAVKVLRAEVAASTDLTRRFRSEIKLARRVRQPNVCAIHEYGEDGDLRYISMELINGTDLKRLIQEAGRFETGEAFRVVRQIAEGLKAIHAIGVIHRDLKTANIMLDDRGLVHVMDFGIAKQFGAEAAASATATGHILGTPEYMSPEQARGEPLDPRTDIYALGIVMFEIFTGDVPFHGDTPVATLFKQIQDPPPVGDPRLPRSLSAVLEKPWRRTPAIATRSLPISSRTSTSPGRRRLTNRPTRSWPPSRMKRRSSRMRRRPRARRRSCHRPRCPTPEPRRPFASAARPRRRSRLRASRLRRRGCGRRSHAPPRRECRLPCPGRPRRPFHDGPHHHPFRHPRAGRWRTRTTQPPRRPRTFAATRWLRPRSSWPAY